MIRTASRRALLAASASLFSLVAVPAFAQTTAAPAPAASSQTGGQVSEIVVTAQRLDAARSEVEPALGATTYSMPEAFINNLPSGANVQLNQVILQAPGVVQDSYGGLHVRGDHANLQYRINGVIIPESAADDATRSAILDIINCLVLFDQKTFEGYKCRHLFIRAIQSVYMKFILGEACHSCH